MADGEIEDTKVKRRSLNVNGVPIGKANKNPILATRAYGVEYSD